MAVRIFRGIPPVWAGPSGTLVVMLDYGRRWLDLHIIAFQIKRNYFRNYFLIRPDMKSQKFDK